MSMWAEKYGPGLAGSRPAQPVDSPLPALAGPAVTDRVPPIHPDSPLLWFGVIAAAAVGLMYASTTVRVGPLKAAVSAGNS